MKRKNKRGSRSLFNNDYIEVTHYGLLSGKVCGEVRIAHLSDLHEKEFGRGNARLFRMVAGLKPDLIAVTGDIIAHSNQLHAAAPYTERLARGLSAIAPTYFVTGNHERLFDRQVTGVMRDCGVTVLRGGVHIMDIRGTRVNVSGMDDLSYMHGDVRQFLCVYERMEGFNVFLSHRPEIFPIARGRNIDLILSGHTHAGQIRIPMLSRVYMQGQGFFPKFMQGEITDGKTTMVISRGLGASGYPTFRMNNPPDLVGIYLEPDSR